MASVIWDKRRCSTPLKCNGLRPDVGGWDVMFVSELYPKCGDLPRCIQKSLNVTSDKSCANDIGIVIPGNTLPLRQTKCHEH